MSAPFNERARALRPAEDAAQTAFGREVLQGLSQARKTLPCTWLYDHRGSELFEDITLLPEYYPTRAEIRLLAHCAPRIAELAGSFNDANFRHESRYGAQKQRVEMHLVSRCAQQAQVLGRTFEFTAGESIHTESSYKLGPVKFQAMAKHAGWSPVQLWMDDAEASRFTVYLFKRSL